MKAIALLTTLALTLALASCMTTTPIEEIPKTDIPESIEVRSTETESGSGSESGLEQNTEGIVSGETLDADDAMDDAGGAPSDVVAPSEEIPEDSAQDLSNGYGGLEASDGSKDANVYPESNSVTTTIPGTKGPSGGTAFVCDGRSLEAMVLDTDGRTYSEALTTAQNFAILTKTTAYFRWRLPTSQELLCIYEQLFETGLMDIDETYYWASSAEDEDTAPVLYFGTGFESEFYKDMDFVGSIIVREL